MTLDHTNRSLYATLVTVHSGQHSFSSPYHNTVVSMSDFGAILAALDLFLFLKNRRKIENLARSLD